MKVGEVALKDFLAMQRFPVLLTEAQPVNFGVNPAAAAPGGLGLSLVDVHPSSELLRVLRHSRLALKSLSASGRLFLTMDLRFSTKMTGALPPGFPDHTDSSIPWVRIQTLRDAWSSSS